MSADVKTPDIHGGEEWQKPLPLPDAISAPYWEAAAQGRLLIQECKTCGHRQWYPRAMCTKCAADVEWLECSGKGEIHTFTVIRQMGMRPFRDELPYVIAMVQLEEGPLVFGNVTGIEPDEVRIGAPVGVWFTRAADDIGVPSWRPV
jgi:uncharacterized OB-fold protein